MEKKYLVIGIILIIVVGAGLIYYTQFNHDTIQVGEIKFQIPNGYKFDGLNGDGNPTITDGANSIYFSDYNDTDVAKIVKNYVHDRALNNISVAQSNFTVNGIIVYKALSSQGASHYWFAYGGKTYSIFTWKNVFNIDNIVFNLVSSIK